MPSETTMRYFMDKARDASLLSDFHKQQIGAIMVYGHKIIAIASNQEKTLPMQKSYNRIKKYNQDIKNNGARHAEISLLHKTRNLNIDWSKVVIYVYREHKETHDPQLARPCIACAQALRDRGIRTVYYSDSERLYGRM